MRFLRHIERNAVLLFMVPADTDDIKKEYSILCNELQQFNPDLVDKPRVLAITKCDMLDDELMDEMRNEVPEGVECVFISSVANMGLVELKDALWRAINDENNRIPTKITHRDLDAKRRVKEEDEFIFDVSDIPVEEEEEWDEEWDDEEEFYDDDDQFIYEGNLDEENK